MKVNIGMHDKVFVELQLVRSRKKKKMLEEVMKNLYSFRKVTKTENLVSNNEWYRFKTLTTGITSLYNQCY